MKNEFPPQEDNTVTNEPVESETSTVEVTNSNEADNQGELAEHDNEQTSEQVSTDKVEGEDVLAEDESKNEKEEERQRQLEVVRGNLNPPDNESRSEKQKIWDDKLKEIEQITDAVGKPIEEGIMETVVAFNVMEINTSQSCAGHEDMEGGQRLWPWVEISAPDKPENQFEGEDEIFEKIAKANEIKPDDLKKGKPRELWVQALTEAARNPKHLFTKIGKRKIANSIN